ncbi:PBPRA1643 family SWIM/SEC-C metal-binding motif protein [Photobacterium aphoticum]|uniref:SEC-C motif n=1 Tax=Photobacterium aphoticum TaxID=754436 RepID=A0A090QUT4_9GAMM|nr:PBPRA1643 family SWIM/SEC-C metal-binding motif protein [Photobacterium aphoticum]KLU98734.1 zinc chelation protein SecC [Photobacterium aphoticum]PSU55986.1 zinc chelation protein SecC [Photobacterium aphoticum]GAL06671.1 SEC-C motif [Photobacterium aphoticum]GHA51817.1 zinc chelation protein SecC [Photobacterium aphoticum]
MSKFFYKGRIEKKPKYESFGYNTKRAQKLGTEVNPLALIVNSEEKKAEVEALLATNAIVATITVDSTATENLSELDMLINKPKTVVFEKTPDRNDPCSCGSGKKYKKCCA